MQLCLGLLSRQMVTKTPVQNRKIEKKVFPVVYDAYIWSEGPRLVEFWAKIGQKQ